MPESVNSQTNSLKRSQSLNFFPGYLLNTPSQRLTSLNKVSNNAFTVSSENPLDNQVDADFSNKTSKSHTITKIFLKISPIIIGYIGFTAALLSLFAAAAVGAPIVIPVAALLVSTLAVVRSHFSGVGKDFVQKFWAMIFNQLFKVEESNQEGIAKKARNYTNIFTHASNAVLFFASCLLLQADANLLGLYFPLFQKILSGILMTLIGSKTALSMLSTFIAVKREADILKRLKENDKKLMPSSPDGLTGFINTLNSLEPKSVEETSCLQKLKKSAKALSIEQQEAQGKNIGQLHQLPEYQQNKENTWKYVFAAALRFGVSSFLLGGAIAADILTGSHFGIAGICFSILAGLDFGNFLCSFKKDLPLRSNLIGNIIYYIGTKLGLESTSLAGFAAAIEQSKAFLAFGGLKTLPSHSELLSQTAFPAAHISAAMSDNLHKSASKRKNGVIKDKFDSHQKRIDSILEILINGVKKLEDLIGGQFNEVVKDAMSIAIENFKAKHPIKDKRNGQKNKRFLNAVFEKFQTQVEFSQKEQEKQSSAPMSSGKHTSTSVTQIATKGWAEIFKQVFKNEEKSALEKEQDLESEVINWVINKICQDLENTNSHNPETLKNNIEKILIKLFARILEYTAKQMIEERKTKPLLRPLLPLNEPLDTLDV